MKKFLAASLALACASVLNTASAANIAIFGDNAIGSFLDTAHDVTLVSVGDLEDPNFLNPFDLFIYTREGALFGDSLTPEAAGNVKRFVTGNIVLFASDMQDEIYFDGDQRAVAEKLLSNAVGFTSNKGYIGEFAGACAAMTSNYGKFEPLGLIAGDCSRLAIGPGGDPMDTIKPLHPVVAGVPDPVDLLDSHQYFATLGDVDQSLIVAINSQGIPSIVATPAQVVPVPEPASLALLGIALAAAGAMRRRQG